MVNDPSHFPANAAVLIALHHGPGGGAASHMWCQVDKLQIETHGSDNHTFGDQGSLAAPINPPYIFGEGGSGR